MCKPKRDGGRRCAIHLHISGAAIKVASRKSGLTRYQVERLFAELTREARGGNTTTVNQDVIKRRILRAAEPIGLTETVEEDLTKSREYDRELDPETVYALQTIIDRSVERAMNVTRYCEQVANQTGLTVAEVHHKYETVRDQFFKKRGAANPPEYNPTARARAARRNLPYDMASVVALEKLKELQTETKKRVVLQTVPVPNSVLQEYGYHEGRLELVYKNGVKHSYRNVPEQVWVSIKNSKRPTRNINSLLAGKPEYQYADEMEDKKDSLLYRCASCGQFASNQHSCPERVMREEIATVVPVEQVEEVLTNRTQNNQPEQAGSGPTERTLSLPEIPSPVYADTVINPLTQPPTPEGMAMFDSTLAATIVPSLPDTISSQYDSETELSTTVWSYDQTNYANRYEALNNVIIPDQRNSHLLSRYPETMKMIKEGRKHHVEYVFDKNDPSKVLASYDSRYFVNLINVSKPGIYRYFESKENKTYTREEAEAFIEEKTEEFKALVETQNVIRVGDKQTLTQIIVDKNYGDRNHKDKFTLGNISNIKKALKENKAFVLPVVWEVGQGSNKIDSYGTYIPSSYNATIRGEVLARKGSNGQIEVISSERTLKCQCNQYRRTYYCQHIRYVNTHIPVVLAKTVNIATIEGLGDKKLEQKAKILGRQLLQRTDTTIEYDEDNNPFVKVNPNSRETEIVYRDNVIERVILPEEFTNISGVATPEQIQNFYTTYEMVESIQYMNRPQKIGQLSEALKRADVSLPVKVLIKNPHYNADSPESGQRLHQLEGNIVYAKKTNPNDPPQIKSHTLKCDCPEYAENYDCKHVRFLLNQNKLVLQPNLRRTSSEAILARDSYNNFVIRNQVEISKEKTIRQTMIANQVSREEAIALVQAREEAERERARERERAAAENARLVRENIVRRRTEESIANETAPHNEKIKQDTAEYRSRMMEKWETPDAPLTPSDFYDAVHAAHVRKSSGEPVLRYRKENVTDGIAAPVDGARRFGVEIEFDFPSNMSISERNDALREIGKDLFMKDLTSQPGQDRYHSGAASGWANWNFENDSTVAGEIVSPIMADTPESWEQIETVCDVLKKHGAVASTRTGSHVHVSTASYGASTAKYAQLLRDTNADDDVIYRLASNPTRGSHRGITWCAPNVDDDHGDISEDVLAGHSVLSPIRSDNHRIPVNFGGSGNREYAKRHVEFRQWDGTLDESIIQTQVMLSLAMVDKAERTVIENKGTKPVEEKEPRVKRNKSNSQNYKRLNNENADKFLEDSAPAIDFINSLFRKNEDRERVSSLFAITNWA